MVVHNFVLEAGDELHVTCAASASANANNSKSAVSNDSQFGGKKNRKNNTRKQEGGKKKLSGFMKFSKEERPNIMKENPGIEFTQVGKKLGEKWRALSDSEKKRY
jgi:structure-specific recognition protein 1